MPGQQKATKYINTLERDSLYFLIYDSGLLTKEV